MGRYIVLREIKTLLLYLEHRKMWNEHRKKKNDLRVKARRAIHVV